MYSYASTSHNFHAERGGLNRKQENLWISKCGPTNWLGGYSDLNQLELFLLQYEKNANEVRIDSLQNLTRKNCSRNSKSR